MFKSIERKSFLEQVTRAKKWLKRLSLYQKRGKISNKTTKTVHLVHKNTKCKQGKMFNGTTPFNHLVLK